MASVANIPECGVCKTPYKYGGPAPYLLPCLHSVCETCLDSDIGDTLFCSVCHEYFLKTENNFPHGCSECLSQTDADSSCNYCSEKSQITVPHLHFPKDAVTENAVFVYTAEHSSSELLCANRNDGNQAMSWCQKCKAFLCEHCQASHEDMKATMSHVIVLVKDLASSGMGGHKGQDQCSVHDAHPLELYDQNCNVLICYKCTRTTHKDCIFESLEERIDKITTETIEEQMKALAEKVKLNNEIEQAFQRKERVLDEKKMGLEQMIKQTFGELKCRLDQREEEIKSQLDVCVDLLRNQDSENLRQLHADKARCTAALEFDKKTVTLSSPSCLLEMTDTIDKRNKSCLSAGLPCVREEATSISFLGQELQMLKDVIARFGGFSTHLREDGLQTQQEEYVSISKNKLDEAVKTERILRKENASLKVQLSSHLESKQKEKDVIASINVASLDLDTRRANNKVHVSGDKKLVNTDSPIGFFSNSSLGSAVDRTPFVKFVGTTCTRTLSKTHVEYWEAHIKFSIVQTLAAFTLLFEIGFCVETQIDKKSKVNHQPDSVVLYLRQCKVHNRICLRSKKDGQGSICLEQFFPNLVGTTAVLKYGILTNPQRQQCIFFDANTNRILHAHNCVNFSKTYWPVFGVHNRNFAQVEIACFSGDIIQPNCGKRNLIISALQGMSPSSYS